MWQLFIEFLILFDFLTSFSLIYKYIRICNVFMFNINLYLLIIKVLIISTSLAGTEVRFAGIKFMFLFPTITPETLAFFFKFKLYLLDMVHISTAYKIDTGDSWLTVNCISTILHIFLQRLDLYHLSWSVCSYSLGLKCLLQSSYKIPAEWL